VISEFPLYQLLGNIDPKNVISCQFYLSVQFFLELESLNTPCKCTSPLLVELQPAATQLLILASLLYIQQTITTWAAVFLSGIMKPCPQQGSVYNLNFGLLISPWETDL